MDMALREGGGGEYSLFEIYMGLIKDFISNIWRYACELIFFMHKIAAKDFVSVIFFPAGLLSQIVKAFGKWLKRLQFKSSNATWRDVVYYYSC